mgnify:CR=1 FL=1
MRGRKPLWIAIITVVAWLGISGAAGPMFGNLSSVQKNDNSDFLPKSAESYKFTQEYKPFSANSDRSIPALVLFTGKIDQNAIASANGFLQTIPGKSLDGYPNSKISEYLVPGAPIFAFPSQDGQALLGSLSFDAKKIANQIDKKPALPIVIESIRNYADEFAKSGGYEAHVTGFAAIFADLFKAFGGIDSTLLLWTLGIVALILIVVYRSPVLWIFPLMSALIAESVAGAVIYVLAKNDILTLDGQSQGILSVLVIGAATDYAMLLIARYREELHQFDSKYDAGRALVQNDNQPFPNFTTQENQGKDLFLTPPVFDASGSRIAGGLGCQGCHAAPEFDIDPNTGNNGVIGVLNAPGIDINITRAPSLRNLMGISGNPNTPMMHTGNFETLQNVIGHYGRINLANGNTRLDPRLRPNGFGQQLNLTATEVQSVVAFIKTLTGTAVYTDSKWSDPF